MKRLLIIIMAHSLLGFTAWAMFETDKITWHLNDIKQVGGYTPVVLGSPVVKIEGKDSGVFFNGINDGLVVPAIPIEGWPKFTIEVLFKPDSDGPVAPRFIHFEDT